MAIYKIIDKHRAEPLDRSTFSEQGLRERDHLQAILKNQIDIIAPDTLLVAEEFSEWKDSQRRIDLLAIDKEANLVVIELKRTEDGGHMELQAIRYAAMISTLTFDRLISIYQLHLDGNGGKADAKTELLEFLEWEEPDEEQFAQEVRIVLASADFSKELTTSVMWLNGFGMDIRCVRMRPYAEEGKTLLDVQTVIPIPEMADYQVGIREKRQRELESRKRRVGREYRFSIAGEDCIEKNINGMMFRIITGIVKTGRDPESVRQAVPSLKNKIFEILPGEMNAKQVHAEIMKKTSGWKNKKINLFFTEEGEFFYHGGKTWVITKHWSKVWAEEAITCLSKKFPDLKISVQAVKEAS